MVPPSFGKATSQQEAPLSSLPNIQTSGYIVAIWGHTVYSANIRILLLCGFTNANPTDLPLRVKSGGAHDSSVGSRGDT